MIRICVVEDEPDMREALKKKISNTPGLAWINGYARAADAAEGIARDQPDIVLMDLVLPGESGIDCMSQLKRRHRKIRFLVFTQYEQDEKVFNALAAGAEGYVLKKDGLNGVIGAIRELARNGAPMSREIARKVITNFHHFDETGAVEKLTRREKEILHLLEEGLFYKEIGSRLRPPISEGTVKQHIHRIYGKLQVNNRTEAIRKLRR